MYYVYLPRQNHDSDGDYRGIVHVEFCDRFDGWETENDRDEASPTFSRIYDISMMKSKWCVKNDTYMMQVMFTTQPNRPSPK